MVTEHPITPPPELVQQWDNKCVTADMPDQLYIATQAARWGADQELEACVEWVKTCCPLSYSCDLRAARRPKPPSLKEQALLKTIAILDDPGRALLDEVREVLELNRRALEQLND